MFNSYATLNTLSRIFKRSSLRMTFITNLTKKLFLLMKIASMPSKVFLRLSNPIKKKFQALEKMNATRHIEITDCLIGQIKKNNHN